MKTFEPIQSQKKYQISEGTPPVVQISLTGSLRKKRKTFEKPKLKGAFGPVVEKTERRPDVEVKVENIGSSARGRYQV